VCAQSLQHEVLVRFKTTYVRYHVIGVREKLIQVNGLRPKTPGSSPKLTGTLSMSSKIRWLVRIRRRLAMFPEDTDSQNLYFTTPMYRPCCWGIKPTLFPLFLLLTLPLTFPKTRLSDVMAVPSKIPFLPFYGARRAFPRKDQKKTRGKA
jgi:hypothetical protein